jgi:hypothetical protein
MNIETLKARLANSRGGYLRHESYGLSITQLAREVGADSEGEVIELLRGVPRIGATGIKYDEATGYVYFKRMNPASAVPREFSEDDYQRGYVNRSHDLSREKGARDAEREFQEAETPAAPRKESPVARLERLRHETGTVAEIIRACVPSAVNEPASAPAAPAKTARPTGRPFKNTEGLEAQCRQEWQTSPELRAEFSSLAAYTAYRAAEARGRVGVLVGHKVVQGPSVPGRADR